MFLAYATVCKEMLGNTEIFSMDDKLDPEQKVIAAQRVMFTRPGGSPYQITMSGFAGEGEVEFGVQGVMEIYKQVFKDLEVVHKETEGKYISQMPG